MGNNCHFAHGPQELRAQNSTAPSNTNQGFNGLRKPRTGPTNPGLQNTTSSTNNYKTVQCKYFVKGSCKFEQNCTFAHGDFDVRQNSQGGARPVKPSNPTGTSPTTGGNNSAIQNQIAQVQIQTLGMKMEAFHSHDQELLHPIKQANELVKAGNIQDAASILYSIMNRPEKREGDMPAYSKFQTEIKTLGDSYYEQYYSQSLQQANVGQGGFGQSGQTTQQNAGFNNYNQGGFQQQQGFGGGNENYYQGGGSGYGSQGYQSEGNFQQGGNQGYGGHRGFDQYDH